MLREHSVESRADRDGVRRGGEEAWQEGELEARGGQCLTRDGQSKDKNVDAA